MTCLAVTVIYKARVKNLICKLLTLIIIEESNLQRFSHSLLDDMTNVAPAQMYVLTNQKNIRGAAMMLYDDMLEKAAEKLGGDVYVIPSSIHETL